MFYKQCNWVKKLNMFYFSNLKYGGGRISCQWPPGRWNPPICVPFFPHKDPRVERAPTGEPRRECLISITFTPGVVASGQMENISFPLLSFMHLGIISLKLSFKWQLNVSGYLAWEWKAEDWHLFTSLTFIEPNMCQAIWWLNGDGFITAPTTEARPVCRRWQTVSSCNLVLLDVTKMGGRGHRSFQRRAVNPAQALRRAPQEGWSWSAFGWTVFKYQQGCHAGGLMVYPSRPIYYWRGLLVVLKKNCTIPFETSFKKYNLTDLIQLWTSDI